MTLPWPTKVFADAERPRRHPDRWQVLGGLACGFLIGAALWAPERLLPYVMLAAIVVLALSHLRRP